MALSSTAMIVQDDERQSRDLSVPLRKKKF